MPNVNVVAILVAALSAFALGGVWYSPLAFGRRWQVAAGLSDRQLAARPPLLVFGGSLLLSIVAATVFAMFLGPSPSMALGVGAGLSAGLCWVAASLGINYLFEARRPSLFMINGSYHTLQFTLYGAILAAWH
jgi:hypothetical protein